MGRPRKKPHEPVKLPEVPHHDTEELDAASSVIQDEAEKAQAKLLLAEFNRRKLDPLRIYRPLPNVLKFHQSPAKERLIFGSNRAAKTTAAVVEVAFTVRNCHPFLERPKSGVLYAVGKDGKHVAQVMWKKLSKPGLFQIVKEDSGEWVPVVPDNPEHAAKKADWRPAPPVIPPNLYSDDTIAWEDKKFGIPSKVTLTTGWEIVFVSSLAAPSQGIAVHGVWFDEEIEVEEWYDELAVRGTMDFSGFFIWSATPQAATQKLFDLWERCESGHDPDAKAFFLHVKDNIYVPKDEVETMRKRWTPDVAEVRYEGKFAILALRVYPEFNREVHGIESFPIPETWTRYMVLDPGYMVCAGVFFAVPPPKEPVHGDYIYVYDEIYLRNSLPSHFAEEVARRAKFEEYEKFIIDYHMGRQTRGEGGTNVELQYSAELKLKNVQSRMSGNGFEWGCDNIDSRENDLRKLLQIRPGIGPTMRIFRDKCPNLCYEFERFMRVKKAGGVVTKERQKRFHDAIDASEYWAAHYREGRAGYVAKKVTAKRTKLSAVEAARQRDEDEKARKAATFGGGGIRLGGEVQV